MNEEKAKATANIRYAEMEKGIKRLMTESYLRIINGDNPYKENVFTTHRIIIDYRIKYGEETNKYFLAKLSSSLREHGIQMLDNYQSIAKKLTNVSPAQEAKMIEAIARIEKAVSITYIPSEDEDVVSPLTGAATWSTLSAAESQAADIAIIRKATGIDGLIKEGRSAVAAYKASGGVKSGLVSELFLSSELIIEANIAEATASIEAYQQAMLKDILSHKSEAEGGGGGGGGGGSAAKSDPASLLAAAKAMEASIENLRGAVEMYKEIMASPSATLSAAADIAMIVGTEDIRETAAALVASAAHDVLPRRGEGVDEPGKVVIVINKASAAAIAAGRLSEVSVMKDGVEVAAVAADIPAKGGAGGGGGSGRAAKLATVSAPAAAAASPASVVASVDTISHVDLSENLVPGSAQWAAARLAMKMKTNDPKYTEDTYQAVLGAHSYSAAKLASEAAAVAADVPAAGGAGAGGSGGGGGKGGKTVSLAASLKQDMKLKVLDGISHDRAIFSGAPAPASARMPEASDLDEADPTEVSREILGSHDKADSTD